MFSLVRGRSQDFYVGSRDAARNRSLRHTLSHDPAVATGKTEEALSMSPRGGAKVGVSLRGLTKIYRISRTEEKIAVDNLTLDFRVGEVTALLGHNGAGKSTTM